MGGGELVGREGWGNCLAKGAVIGEWEKCTREKARGNFFRLTPTRYYVQKKVN